MNEEGMRRATAQGLPLPWPDTAILSHLPVATTWLAAPSQLRWRREDRSKLGSAGSFQQMLPFIIQMLTAWPGPGGGATF